VLHDVSIQAEDSGEFPLSVTVLLPHHEALAQSFRELAAVVHLHLARERARV